MSFLVRILEPSLLKIAPLAFECQLWSIRPNIARYPLNNWPVPALNYVCSLILERQVEAEIKAVARNLVKCDILLDIQSNRTNQNQRYNEMGRSTLRQSLIHKGFGETANEEHIFEVNLSFITNQEFVFDIYLFSMIIEYVVMLNDLLVIQLIYHSVLIQVIHQYK